jgi:hypothetical protein
VSSLDTFCTKFTAGLTFNVGGMPDDDNAATAFFPSWSRDRRELKIDWDDAWNENPRARIGLLIHELGHALGFFHEHVRVPQTGDCALSVQGLAFPVTAYDPLSVMHYFDCPDSANTTDYWFITQRDLEGAQHLYEAPTNVLDVNSNAVYARKASDGQFYKKLPTGTGWALVSAPAVAFVDIGNDLYQRTAGNQIKKYTGSGTTWGPSIATDAWQIFECVGLLCATFGDGTIRRYASGTWTVIGGPGSRFVATASQLFGLSPLQDQVHRWNSGTSWTNIAGAGFSEIFANDGHIFGLTRPRSRVHQTNGFSAWESIGGTGRQWVGAGQFLYRLETDRQGVWRYANGTWDQIEGPTKRLYASNTTLYRTDSANTIYRWNGTTWVLVGTL